MNKKKILGKLLDYFIEKGEVMSYRAYSLNKDTPIRPVLAKRLVSSWSRLPVILQRNFPEKYALIGKPVANKPKAKAKAVESTAKPVVKVKESKNEK